MNNNELYHHGILGMKWGVRRFQPYGQGGYNPEHTGKNVGLAKKKRTPYRSTSLKSAIARRQNEKVDKSFKTWNEESAKKKNAIELGKKKNALQIEYENDKSNSDKKRAYKAANKEYKRALASNTTYRKGDIRREVGSDISRKHLSEAKRIEKLLKQDPNNAQLQKQYSDLMSRHDSERASARRAPQVAQKRSARKAALKRTMTMTAKTAVIGGATAAGLAAVNKYANIDMNPERVADFIRKGKGVMQYVY